MKILLCGAATFVLAAATPALAQMDHAHMSHAMPAPAPAPVPSPTPPAPAGQVTPAADSLPAPNMPATMMDHSQMNHAQPDQSAMPGMDHGAGAMAGEGSGTSRLPANETMHHGLHLPLGGDTTLMLHGYAWPIYTKQTGPRGDDKAYVQSMAMATLTTPLAGGKFTAKTMLSLEPAMRHDGYPNLFATGEVAYGQPLVDRQHPHDLFMELSGRFDLDIAPGTTAFLYGGPVGEPALGPSAFMHRASAKYNPEAPITHHWFDSTHITYGVVTAGIDGQRWQLEGSAFRGREPDEFRWNIEEPKLDSWSVRGSFAPSPAWLLQASYGRLEEPEEQHPGEDERRFTASAHYNDGRGLSAMAAFSAKNRVPGDTLTAFLGEANWDITSHHTVFGRIENVANDELFSNPANPLHDRIFRVTKFQAGYAFRVPIGPVEMALGGTLSAFAKPAALDAAYGRNPMGYTVFARFALGG